MYSRLSVLWVILLSVPVVAQQKPAAKHHPSTPAAHGAVQPAASTPLPSEQTVNAFMQQMFGYDPSLTWKITTIRPSEAAGLAEVSVALSSPRGQQAMRFYVSEDGQHALAGQIMPFGATPFAKARQELEKGAHGPSHGPADAAVTIVEFSDLQCPHCKDAQPLIQKLMTDVPNARMILQNFPLPAHDWAAKAAAYADCVGRSSNEAFWKFVPSVYEAQAQITAANADEKLNGLADAAGVKSSDIAACAAQPETTARVQESLALGKEVGVEGTPTLFINGRKVDSFTGIPFEVMKQLVDFAAKNSSSQPSKAQ
jgi:protein-disulfide isomerase